MQVEQGLDASTGFMLVTCFMLGGVLCGLIINKQRIDFGKALYGMVLIFHACLLLMARYVPHPDVALGTTAVACGLQNGMGTFFSGVVIRTTHMTGSTTDLGVLIGKCMRHYIRKASGKQVREESLEEDFWKIQLHVAWLLSFLLGGITGSWAYHILGKDALLPPALLSAGMGSLYVNYRLSVLKQKLFQDFADSELGSFRKLAKQLSMSSNSMSKTIGNYRSPAPQRRAVTAPAMPTPPLASPSKPPTVFQLNGTPKVLPCNGSEVQAPETTESLGNFAKKETEEDEPECWMRKRVESSDSFPKTDTAEPKVEEV